MPRAPSSGRTPVITTASSTTTTTSEDITNPTVKSVSRPAGRVWERMPMTADGLRVMATTPQRRATAKTAGRGMPRVNGTRSRARTKVAGMTRSESPFWTTVAATRLRKPRRKASSRSSAPPASAMSERASEFTTDRSATVW